MRTQPDRKYYAVSEGGVPVLTSSTSAPPGGVELTASQASALSAEIDGRYSRPAPPELTNDADVAKVLKWLADGLTAQQAEIDAIKQTRVIVGVDKGA